VSAYRDDREALREQLEDLRREVATLRGGTPDEASAARLAALGERVERALEQVTRDREVLRDLAEGIAALRGDVAPKESPPPPAPPRPPPVWLLPAGAAIALAAFFVLRAPLAPAPAPAPPTLPLADYSGAPHAVDPLDFYARASRLANGKELTEIRLHDVAPDGTMDLDSPRNQALLRYRFAMAPAAAAEAPPVQAALVDITKNGVYVTNEPNAFAAFNQPVAKPTCTPAKVWAAARAAGAPDSGLANLTYHRRVSEKKPVWEFEIEGAVSSLVIGDPECRALTPDELGAR
jgi:hypothetical protein